MSFSIQNIILGLISLGAGIWMVKEAYHINHHILFMGWAERKWGPGSGTLAYKLLGMIFASFGLLVMFGFIDLFGTAFQSNQVSTQTPGQSQQYIPSPGGPGGRIVD